ncbi:MAG: suppressor of fused domain protein [Myxococcales bacterium]
MSPVLLVFLAAVALGAGYLLLRHRSVGPLPNERAPAPERAAAEDGRRHLDDALDRLYPTERDFRFGVTAGEGEDEAPLAEIVAYRASKPIPHWHYVTYGLSELGRKTSNDPSLSGFGVEYTLRLVADGEQPPFWPMNLLRWVAARVWQTREPLDPSHSMNLPPGMLEEVSPGVEGLGFLQDAELGSIDTPNGKVTFVNVIPLAQREWWLLGAWDFDKYLDAVRSQQGDLLWRVGRGSVLEGPRGAELLAQVERDGSSQSVDFTPIAWTDRELVLDSVSRDVVIKFLRYRLAYGRDAAIVSGTRKATLAVGEWGMQCSGEACRVSIPQEQARALADALAAAGDGATLAQPRGVQFRLELTE